MCPPLCRRHDSQGHVSQVSALVHDRGPVAGTERIAAIPDRVSNQFAVSQIGQRNDETGINQPPSEIRGEPAILVIEISINEPKRVLKKIIAERAVSCA